MANLRKDRIITGKEPCIRCGEPLTNQFRKQPWCLDCGIELQQQDFNGEEVLEIVLAALPPLHLHTVQVAEVHRITRKMLIHKGIFLPPEEPEDDDTGGNKKSLILT